MSSKNSNTLKIFYRSGTTLYEKGGTRANYDTLHQLETNGIPFKVIRKTDGRDITKLTIENIQKKIWNGEEIKNITNYYGKHTLDELHNLYLPKKSVGQIRHKASELSLTVDKNWQKHEVEALSILRRSGISYPIISKILQRPIHAVQVKAQKERIVFHERSSEGLDDVKEKISVYAKLPSLTKGKIAEDITSIKLAENGFDVFTPHTPQHYTDLLVLRGNRIAKIQVKCAIWDEKSGRFRLPLTRKIVAGVDKGQRKLYDEGVIDFFALCCLGIDDIYLVPFQLCKNHRYANLYPHRPKQIQKGFNWEPYRGNFQLLDDYFQLMVSNSN